MSKHRFLLESEPLVTKTTINLVRVIFCLVFMCLWYNGYRIFQNYIGYQYIYTHIMLVTDGRTTKDLGIFDLYQKLGYTYSDVVMAFSRTVSSFVGVTIAVSAMRIGQIFTKLFFVKRPSFSSSSLT